MQKKGRIMLLPLPSPFSSFTLFSFLASFFSLPQFQEGNAYIP
jgi:hypothetical protein